MTDPKQYTWHVEGSLPPDEDHKWRQNANIQVVASTLEVAVAQVTEKYPDFMFVKVFRDRLLRDVIVAQEEDRD